jgi:serine phosphatase RsbU (regulator of sigma subunit)
MGCVLHTKKNLVYYVFLLFVGLSYCPFAVFAQDTAEDSLSYDNYQANPNVVLLRAEQKNYPLIKQVWYLEDKEKALHVEEISQPTYNHRFQLQQKRSINFGYSLANIWLKFEVKNLQPDESWFLEINYPLLDYVEFYSQKHDSTWETTLFGDMIPFSEREISYRNFIIPLHQNDTITRTYFLKVQTKGAMQIPMEIIRAKDFYRENTVSELLYGLFYGVMFVMIFYNIVLYFSLGDSNYLYYTISIFGSTLFIATLAGHTFQHIFPNQIKVAANMVNISLAVWLGGSYLFAKDFLETKKHIPWMHKLFTFFVFVGVMMFALVFGLDYNLMARMGTVVNIVGLLVLVVCGIYCWVKGIRTAKYFILAWSFYMIGLLMLGLKTVGIIPNNYITAHAAEVGAVLEVILLALALTDKYAQMRGERKKVQEQLLAIQKEENIRLEEKVKLRTAEIQQQKEEIEAQRDYLGQINGELATKNDEINKKNEEIEAKTHSLEKSKIEIEQAYEIIQESARSITDSIRYAQTIQLAVLPSEKDMKEVFKSHFLLYKPKDIVSGDFYWLSRFENYTFVAVVDCTGHGVPGAFMSLVGITLLNEIVSQKRIFDPSKMLETLHNLIQHALHQHDKSNDDGMDICLCRIENLYHNTTKIVFAGAKRPLFFVKHDDPTFFVIRGDRKSIGGMQKKQSDFTNQELVIECGGRIYLMSDGLIDQNDAEQNKLGIDNLANLIQAHHKNTLPEQLQFIITMLYTHQGTEAQRDDITLLAIEV